MFALSKIKLWMLVGILCVVIITIHIAPVMADDDDEKLPTKSFSSSSNLTATNPSCISCPDTQPKCPTCPPGIKCVLSIRTCFTCPQASCDDSTSLPTGSPSTGAGKSALPGVIGGVLGAVILIAAGLGCFMYQRKSRKDRGTKLEETTSVNSENVIPIAYIPSTTLKTPENTYQGLNASLYNTPSSDTLIDLTEDEDASCEVGTILQATKTSPVATAANTATLITATRVKPALVRINTIKSNNGSTSSSRGGAPDTSNTPSADRSLQNTPIPSAQNSPTTANIIVGNDNTVNEVPRIDIERSSGESFRPTIQVTSSSSQQHLNSPFLDPIEGRQSFGLFGSDEVYGTDPAAPQIQRVSTTSSASTNGRSTMLSDEGDGEITIFWGGNDAPFMPVVGATSTQNEACGGETNSNIENPSEDTTKTKETT